MSGCTGNRTTNAPSETEANEPTQPSETTNADSNTATSTTNPSNSDLNPVQAVRTYFQEINQGDVTAANRFVLSKSSPMYVNEPANIEITRVENPSLREVIKRTRDVNEEELDNRVEEAQTSIQAFLEDQGYEDHTFISFSGSIDGRTQERYIRLIKDNGVWLILGVGTS